MDFPAIEISIEKNNETKIIGYVTDAQETEYPPINSAQGIWNIGNAVNLYDGNFHNITMMWSMNDTTSYPNYSDSAGVSALRKSVLVVDGKIIGNETTWPGKQTPISFLFDEANKLATFLTIGARTLNSAATSIASSTLVDQTFAGVVKRICIWDRPLGPNSDTNIHIISGFEEPNGNYLGSSCGMSLLTALKYFGDTTTLPSSWWDPLSGSKFSPLSSNVVAYYKFDEDADGSVT